ncbi:MULTISPECIES: cytochrome c biogenesis CcdA family protein [Amycolatopsis]|uniref:Cytochrome C biogenesis protein CcdA n=1 Tax=Amycolatopsis echigonensis TaxID=2576905 RepID=A0A2N3WLD6_9PSEU|nr:MULTISPECIES: cytochrome c biogenesis protein CcdA [Amycolatopsis]MBB2500837.1 cytochrome C biogenesis protein CcdA [Amycolatopsis echigonensis]MCG3751206.1 cytochrome C biogenesis protein CcdA [Amycolatopsis sp. Poz14]PKV94670.1 cytochrome c-type biogenesis protein [Amycolatopsis niigatensis]
MDLYASLSLAIAAGVISFTSPCALPLLPGYVSYVSGLGRAPEGNPTAMRAKPRVGLASALFIAGFTIVFVALGVTASAFGLLLAQHRQILTIAGGVLVIGMGLASLGVVRIPLLQREARFDLHRVRSGPAGAVVLGAAFGLGWTPCVGPVLASILATAASSATLGTGALLLAAYSLGLGVPFVLVAIGVARGQRSLAWLRAHTRKVEIAGGVLLIAMGVVMLTGGWTQLMGRMLAAFARLGWPPL